MYAGTHAEERGGVWSSRETVPIMCIRVGRHREQDTGSFDLA